jgi:hypothetical protein
VEVQAEEAQEVQVVVEVVGDQAQFVEEEKKKKMTTHTQKMTVLGVHHSQSYSKVYVPAKDEEQHETKLYHKP